MKKIVFFLLCFLPSALYPITGANIGKLRTLESDFAQIKMALQKKETILGTRDVFDQLVKRGILLVEEIKKIESTVGANREKELQDITVAVNFARSAVESQRQYEQRVAGYEKTVKELGVSLETGKTELGMQREEVEKLKQLQTAEQKIAEEQRRQREEEVAKLKILSESQKQELEDLKVKQTKYGQIVGINTLEQFSAKVEQSSRAMKETVEAGKATYETWFNNLTIEYLDVITAAEQANTLTKEEASKFRDAVKPSMKALLKSAYEKVIQSQLKILLTEAKKLTGFFQTLLEEKEKSKLWAALTQPLQGGRGIRYDSVHSRLKKLSLPIVAIRERVRSVFTDSTMEIMVSGDQNLAVLQNDLLATLQELFSISEMINTVILTIVNKAEKDTANPLFKKERNLCNALIGDCKIILEKCIVPITQNFAGISDNNWEIGLQHVKAALDAVQKTIEETYPKTQ